MTEPNKDLIRRLRQHDGMLGFLVEEAADALTALQDRVRELEDALQPFSDRLRGQEKTDLELNKYTLVQNSLLVRARAALTAAPSPEGMNGWLPIETAPHNQRVLIAQDGAPPHDEAAMAWLDRMDDQFYYSPQGGIVSWTPTHWRPLHDPPSPTPQTEPRREG